MIWRYPPDAIYLNLPRESALLCQGSSKFLWVHLVETFVTLRDIAKSLHPRPIRGDGFPHPLPWFLREARQLTLHWCEYDFSTATNLLCILEEEKDPMTFIIIADDDMVSGIRCSYL